MTSGPYQERRTSSQRFLPPDPRVVEPHRLTPQLALRVAILGGVALLVFVVLFFRLWSLQVLRGDAYLNAAQSNQLRLIRVEAPRGPLLDRRGRVVVSNVAGTAVQLWVGDLPQHGRNAIVRHLAQVLDIPPGSLVKQVTAHRLDPLTPIVVKTSVGEEQVDYLYEHQDEFPGREDRAGLPPRLSVLVACRAGARVHGRDLTGGAEAASGRTDYRPGDRIGKTGIESSYDTYLRGRSGLAQIRVDSAGRQVSPYVPRQEAGPATRSG